MSSARRRSSTSPATRRRSPRTSRCCARSTATSSSAAARSTCSRTRRTSSRSRCSRSAPCDSLLLGLLPSRGVGGAHVAPEEVEVRRGGSRSRPRAVRGGPTCPRSRRGAASGTAAPVIEIHVRRDPQPNRCAAARKSAKKTMSGGPMFAVEVSPGTCIATEIPSKTPGCSSVTYFVGPAATDQMSTHGTRNATSVSHQSSSNSDRNQKPKRMKRDELRRVRKLARSRGTSKPTHASPATHGGAEQVPLACPRERQRQPDGSRQRRQDDEAREHDRAVLGSPGRRDATAPKTTSPAISAPSATARRREINTEAAPTTRGRAP